MARWSIVLFFMAVAAALVAQSGVSGTGQQVASALFYVLLVLAIVLLALTASTGGPKLPRETRG
jgi:uncharacterized membrane protein YtjA (UPF0391 family)